MKKENSLAEHMVLRHVPDPGPICSAVSTPLANASDGPNSDRGSDGSCRAQQVHVRNESHDIRQHVQRSSLHRSRQACHPSCARTDGGFAEFRRSIPCGWLDVAAALVSFDEPADLATQNDALASVRRHYLHCSTHSITPSCSLYTYFARFAATPGLVQSKAAVCRNVACSALGRGR